MKHFKDSLPYFEALQPLFHFYYSQDILQFTLFSVRKNVSKLCNFWVNYAFKGSVDSL